MEDTVRVLLCVRIISLLRVSLRFIDIVRGEGNYHGKGPDSSGQAGHCYEHTLLCIDATKYRQFH